MRFKLDQKYFVPFIVFCCTIAAVGIAVLTYYYRISKENSFKERIAQFEGLPDKKLPLEFSKDSVSVRDFQNEYLVLNFWASWSSFAKKVHSQLYELQDQNPDRVRVIAASVRNGKKQVQEYKEAHNYPFVYVDGSKLYDELEVPGVPCTIVFNSSNEVVDIIIGYKDSLTFINQSQALVAR